MKKDTNNSLSQAVEVKLQRGRRTIKGSLVEAGDQFDSYRVRLTARSNFTCILDGLEGDANLKLFDRKGREIAASEEGENQSESLSRQLGAGIYFIQVNRVQLESDYRLRFSTNQDAGNSFVNAFKIRPGNDKLKGNFLFADTVNGSDDKADYYRLDLTTRCQFNSLLSGLGQDADITLFDSRRQQIAISANSGRRAERINTVLEAGSYFVKIDLKQKVNAKGLSTKYRFKLSYKSLTIDSSDDGVETARPIDLSPSTKLFNDFVGTADPQDYYKIDLATPSNLNLTLKGLTSDANIELLNGDGTVLGSSTNPGTAQDLVNLSLKAGSYFVRVFPAATNTSTTYSLDFDVDPLRFFGLADNNNLVAFNSDRLDKSVSIGVTGLAAGETLKGIDFRSATGKLLGLSSANKLYTIDLSSGAATAVSSTPFTPALTGTTVGFDFNPTVDRIRVVSDADENLRINPDTGVVVDTDLLTPGTQLDTALSYASGDVNFGQNPNVDTAAYTNNFAGATSTSLYGIDTTLNTLVLQGSAGGSPTSPNTGSLTTVGALGFDIAANAGFDIFTDAGLTNTAYVTSGSTLYSVNLTTGQATNVGTVSTGTGTTPINLVGLAIRG
jgi:hypothetical protein